ncbi:MAG: hypothetical protein ACRC6N_13105 [Plesiomonas sp.]|uniref:hypothetical protein n=1 Tax=Plesiomonas sp. TaxID=2486279 RepID=UPI003F2C858E
MNYSASIRALLQRCAIGQQRCEAELVKLAHRDRVLQRELEALHEQREGLTQLILAQRPAGHITSAELFALQRKQAVLRRQQLNLSLQHGELVVQREEIVQLRTEQQGRHAYWLRKEDKYQRWAKSEARRNRLRTQARDEAELEERIKWK